MQPVNNSATTGNKTPDRKEQGRLSKEVASSRLRMSPLTGSRDRVVTRAIFMRQRLLNVKVKSTQRLLQRQLEVIDPLVTK